MRVILLQQQKQQQQQHTWCDPWVSDSQSERRNTINQDATNNESEAGRCTHSTTGLNDRIQDVLCVFAHLLPVRQSFESVQQQRDATLKQRQHTITKVEALLKGQGQQQQQQQQ